MYASHISNWEAERDKLEVKALEPRKRGPKPQPQPDPEVATLLDTSVVWVVAEAFRTYGVL